MLSVASTFVCFHLTNTLICRTCCSCAVWCCWLNFVTFVKIPKYLQSCRRQLLDFTLHERTFWSAQTSSSPVERNLKSTLKWSACCGRINMHERNFIRAEEERLQVCMCVCVCHHWCICAFHVHFTFIDLYLLNSIFPLLSLDIFHRCLWTNLCSDSGRVLLQLSFSSYTFVSRRDFLSVSEGGAGS